MSGSAPRSVVLIASASDGLGSAIARALAEAGYDLVLMSRSGCADIARETGGNGVAGSVLNDGDAVRTVAAGMTNWPH
jgi:NAD(P)-dependent dehydrogenase (short-subunit alcohol dehydrogenase family)